MDQEQTKQAEWIQLHGKALHLLVLQGGLLPATWAIGQTRCKMKSSMINRYSSDWIYGGANEQTKNNCAGSVLMTSAIR